jgi:TRAP-type mannitol/chloroaromatic compound transport system permease large subunit
MSEPTIFTLGISGTVLISMGVMTYLQRPLRSVLTDLCGTADRASFWGAFSNITLFLLPLLFLLGYRPEDAPGAAPLWSFAEVFERGLLGLALTVVVLGIVMGSFIRRVDARLTAPHR